MSFVPSSGNRSGSSSGAATGSGVHLSSAVNTSATGAGEASGSSDESRIFAPSFRVEAEDEDCYDISSLPLCASSSIGHQQLASSCLTASAMTAGSSVPSSSTMTAAAVVSAAATMTAALSSTACPPLSPAFDMPPDSILYNLPSVISKSSAVSASSRSSNQQSQQGSGYCSICAPFSNPIIRSDHRVCMIPLNKGTFAHLPADTIRILCCGTYALHFEEETGRSAIVFLMLEQSLGSLLWCRGTSSGLKSTFSSNHRDTPSPGRSYHTLSTASTKKNLVTKEMQDRLLHLMINRFDSREIYSTGLEEGLIDLMHAKDASLSASKIDLSVICRKSGIKSVDIDPGSCLRLMFGNSLSDNRSLQFILPKDSVATWSKGISSLLKLLLQQTRMTDKRLTWLKYKYLQLYYNPVKPCTHPTPADAIKSFGGRKWTLTGLEISSSNSATAAAITAANEGNKNAASSCYSSPSKSSHRPSFLSARNSLTAVGLFSSSSTAAAGSKISGGKRRLLQKKQSASCIRDDDWGSESVKTMATTAAAAQVAKSIPPDSKRITDEKADAGDEEESLQSGGKNLFHRRSLRFSLRKVSSRHSFSLFSPFRSRRGSSFNPGSNVFGEDAISSSSSASTASAGLLHQSIRSRSTLDERTASDPGRKSSSGRTCDSPAVQKRTKGWFGSQKNLSHHQHQAANLLASSTENLPATTSSGNHIKVTTSIAHSSQVNFFEFTELYRSFMIRSRPDIKQLFDKLSQHGISEAATTDATTVACKTGDTVTSLSSTHQQQHELASPASRDATLMMTTTSTATACTVATTAAPLTTIIATTSAALMSAAGTERETDDHEHEGKKSRRTDVLTQSQLGNSISSPSDSGGSFLFDPMIRTMAEISEATFKKVNLPAKRRNSAVDSCTLISPVGRRTFVSQAVVSEACESSVTSNVNTDSLSNGAMSSLPKLSLHDLVDPSSTTSSVACANRRTLTDGVTFTSSDVHVSSSSKLQHHQQQPRVTSSVSTAAVCQSSSPSAVVPASHSATPLDLHDRRKSLSIASASGSTSSTAIDQRSDAPGIRTRRGSLFTVARDTLIAAATRRDVKSDDQSSSQAKGMSSKSNHHHQPTAHKHRQAVTRGLLTRNSNVTCNLNEDDEKRVQRSMIWDAIASASIVSNSTGMESRSRCDVLNLDQFSYFIRAYQREDLSDKQIRDLIKRHEPDVSLRQQAQLSFEGFSCFLLDKENFAFTPEQNTYIPDDMNESLSHYYMATSHNTYLTGHQLRGESSVELYSNVLKTGCRCVELDCWDGEDGFPVIYHGHTLTSKISFRKVIQAINDAAFQASSFPVILSLENHCSLPQQSRMAQIFVSIIGDKLITGFQFDTDFLDQPRLPTPNQLKYKILIKNKKLRSNILPSIQHRFRKVMKGTKSSPVSNNASPGPSASASAILSSVSGSATQSGQHATADRTSSLLSVASSGSMNEEDDESDDEEDDDDEMNMTAGSIGSVKQKSSHASRIATTAVLRTESSSSQEGVPSCIALGSAGDSSPLVLDKQQPQLHLPLTSPQTLQQQQQSQSAMIHRMQNQASLQPPGLSIDAGSKSQAEKAAKVSQQQQQQLYAQLQQQQQHLKQPNQQSVQKGGKEASSSGRKSSQVAPDLSDLVNYVQAVKFRGLFVDVKTGNITTSPTAASLMQQQLQQSSSPAFQMNQQQSYHHQQSPAVTLRQSSLSTSSLPVSKKSSSSRKGSAAASVMSACNAPTDSTSSSLTTISTHGISASITTVTTASSSIADSIPALLSDSNERTSFPPQRKDVQSFAFPLPPDASPSSQLLSHTGFQGTAAASSSSLLASSVLASYVQSSLRISDEAVGGRIGARDRNQDELKLIQGKKMKQQQEEWEMLPCKHQQQVSDPSTSNQMHPSSRTPPAASSSLSAPTENRARSPQQHVMQSSDPQVQESPESPVHEERWHNPAAACYQVPSLNEYTAKKLCRKTPLAVISFTSSQLMRSYPAGMRIDSSNFNPITFWAFGLQMAAINYQTDDIGNAINAALFEQNGSIGLIRKPAVMTDHHHVMYGRFNPWEKEFDGLCAIDLIITVKYWGPVKEVNLKWTNLQRLAKNSITEGV